MTQTLFPPALPKPEKQAVTMRLTKAAIQALEDLKLKYDKPKEDIASALIEREARSAR